MLTCGATACRGDHAKAASRTTQQPCHEYGVRTEELHVLLLGAVSW